MIVHNDFHSTHGIFNLFEGLEIENMDDPVTATKPIINGYHETNGIPKPNNVIKLDAEAISNQVLS